MDKQEQLAQVYQDLQATVSQLPLASEPGDIVPGEGAATAEIMFIGEAPGYHESVEHRPFVGRSGKFFRKTLVEEANIAVEDVYISNIVKARPPENRDPTSQEIAAYKESLDKEINIIKPTIIATLGRFSMGKFLHEVRISQVHGRLHTVKWEGERLFVMPMFHPAAALRNSHFREAFIADFQKLPKVVDWVKENQTNYQLEDEVKAALL